MSKLLINEDPLQVLPGLAVKIGLNEAIILQQMHYWINMNKKCNRNFRDGKHWVYNSYENWQKQFPFWSVMTVKRVLWSLAEKKLLIKGNYNKLHKDRTVWYTINYKNLTKLEEKEDITEVQNEPMENEDTKVQNEPMTEVQNEPMDEFKMNQPLPETTQRLPETNKESSLVIDEKLKTMSELFVKNIKQIPSATDMCTIVNLSQTISKDLFDRAIEATLDAARVRGVKNKSSYFFGTINNMIEEQYGEPDPVEEVVAISEETKKLIGDMDKTMF